MINKFALAAIALSNAIVTVYLLFSGNVAALAPSKNLISYAFNTVPNSLSNTATVSTFNSKSASNSCSDETLIEIPFSL